MKIPNDLSQFNDKNALMIVAGKQDAALYHIHDALIDELLKFVTPKPEYSDNEGRSSGSGNIHGGAVNNDKDENIIRDFIHELSLKLKVLNPDFNEIYLLAPGSSHHKIKDSLPKAWRERVSKELQGNHFHETPIEILQRLAEVV